MEIALLVIFIGCISGGLYICAARCMTNLYLWIKFEDGEIPKKGLLKNWSCFLALAILWVVLCVLSSVFISEFIALSVISLLLLIVDALALRFKGQNRKKDTIVNEISLVTNILLALLLLIFYLVWVF